VAGVFFVSPVGETFIFSINWGLEPELPESFVLTTVAGFVVLQEESIQAITKKRLRFLNSYSFLMKKMHKNKA